MLRSLTSKTFGPVIVAACAMAGAPPMALASFVNLDFEEALSQPDNALFGWYTGVGPGTQASEEFFVSYSFPGSGVVCIGSPCISPVASLDARPPEYSEFNTDIPSQGSAAVLVQSGTTGGSTYTYIGQEAVLPKNVSRLDFSAFLGGDTVFDGNDPADALAVFANGEALDLEFFGPATGQVYNRVSVDVSPYAGDLLDLRFAATSGPNLEANVIFDDISLVAVPLPAASLLLASSIGLVGLNSLRCSRRRGR